MNSRKLLQILLSVLFLLLIAGVVKYYYSKPISETTTNNNYQNTQATTSPSTLGPKLSVDKRSIIEGSEVLLSVDNDEIFNWFKKDSQLCDSNNINITPDRKSFCENKTTFKNLTRFSSIIVSPDKNYIGFSIESDTLSPDNVIGIYSRTTNKVNLLTSYYLGNEFISFSSSGLNFVYQSGCFEAMCGLFVKNSQTLKTAASINNPEYADERGQNVTFVKWITDNKVEYKLGTVLKQQSF